MLINDPSEFKILKQVQSREGEVLHWIPMGKSIANLYRYAQVSRAFNIRYLDAVVQAVPTGEIIEEVEKLCTKTSY